MTSRLRSELKRGIKLAQRNYSLNLESRIRSDPRKTLTYVNNTRRCTGMPVRITYSGEWPNTLERFVNTFIANFTNNNSNCPVTNIEDYFDTTPTVSISLSEISQSEVLSALKS